MYVITLQRKRIRPFAHFSCKTASDPYASAVSYSMNVMKSYILNRFSLEMKHLKLKRAKLREYRKKLGSLT